MSAPAVVIDNSLFNLAASIEAVALRLRASAGSGESHRVLEWVEMELERLQTEAAEMAPEVRLDEVAEQAS